MISKSRETVSAAFHGSPWRRRQQPPVPHSLLSEAAGQVPDDPKVAGLQPKSAPQRAGFNR